MIIPDSLCIYIYILTAANRIGHSIDTKLDSSFTTMTLTQFPSKLTPSIPILESRVPPHYSAAIVWIFMSPGSHLIASLKCKIVNLHSLKLPPRGTHDPFPVQTGRPGRAPFRRMSDAFFLQLVPMLSAAICMHYNFMWHRVLHACYQAERTTSWDVSERRSVGIGLSVRRWRW